LRVKTRLRLALVASGLFLAGCGDPYPISYSDNERLALDLKDKPKLQEAVRKAIADLFGDSPKQIKVPKGAGLPLGGRRLAGTYVEPGSKNPTRLRLEKLDPETWKTAVDPNTGKAVATIGLGGYTLYRHHCLHCHGISGDGAGPTAAFLYPRPRDYRPGLFKFTSTPSGAKPTRLDLRKTILHGLNGTSMPSFESTMTPEQIEQVIDYVIFLSLRGETELNLIDEATVADVKDANPLPDERAQEIAVSVFDKWKLSESQAVNPPARRTLSNPQSIASGRELFLGRTPEKLVCTTCHGPLGQGNGDQWIDEELTYEVVFGREDPEAIMKERVYHGKDPATLDKQTRDKKEAELKNLHDLWTKSLDNWKQPLRPANLNRGVYKGGRRPIDLYWRVANGITGTPMPGHGQAAKPERIWDVVNFLLALPYEPALLRDAPPAPAAAAPQVAQRATREVATP